MFRNASNFTWDIGMRDVRTVSDVRSMFQNASKFNQDLSRWCLQGITNNTNNRANFSPGSPLIEDHLPPLVRYGYASRCLNSQPYQHFITTRDIPSMDKTLIIPTVTGLEYGFTIDW